jgi:hypothetical protein
MLVGEEDQLEVLDREAERGEPVLETRLGLLHQRPRVDERERLAAQQPGVHVTDLERRRERDAVDALGQHPRHPRAGTARPEPPCFFTDSYVAPRWFLPAAPMVPP